MRVNIADIKLEAGSHKRVPVEVGLGPVEIGGQTFAFPKPFTGSAEIWNAGDRILVQAALQGEVQAECSRCLTPFSLPLSLSFEEEFVQGNPADAEADGDVAEERTVSSYEGDEIDLSDSLRDNVLLELPMQPICSEDCKGLCPTCGTNLNEGACQCSAAHSVDPRFAALQKLLKPDHNE